MRRWLWPIIIAVVFTGTILCGVEIDASRHKQTQQQRFE